MGQMTKTAPRGAPALQTPQMFDLVKILGNRVETTPGGRSLISSQNLPTPEQTQALRARAGSLSASLTPRATEMPDVADAILEMFYCWDAGRRMEASKAAKTAAKYAEQVQDLPYWAVKRACDFWARADSAFPPSAGELRAQATKETSVPAEELASIQRILTAETYVANEPEVRERVKEAFHELMADLNRAARR